MKYLVTGGSGFLGNKLIARLFGQGHEVVTVSRNEGKLIELKQNFPSVEIITGDLADPHIARLAVKNVTGIFHLAGFKFVDLAERQPKQCIQSNISASMMLLQAIDNKPMDFIIATSTDKAGHVAGTYGATKLLMEKLFTEFQGRNPQTKYRIVRYGNVLYSTGSVLCKWKKLIQEGKPVTVTDPEATRFFWTIDQAVDLIFECLDRANSSEPYIPHMKSMSIGSLLHAMTMKYAPYREPLQPMMNVIGLQPGENLHETMDGVTFSNDVPQYSIDEIMQLI